MLHLARALLLAQTVGPEALAEAIVLAATQGTSLARGLVASHAIDAPGLEEFLEQYLDGSPVPALAVAVPLMDLALRLPPGLCERLQAVPVRRDPLTGTIDVAVVDARDRHPGDEIAHSLGAPVRVVRTSLASMEAALVKVHAERVRGVRPLAPPMGRAPSPPAPEADVAIPLTRRSPGSVAGVRAAAAPSPPQAPRVGVVVPAPEPVLDLTRRKADPSPRPPAARGPSSPAPPQAPPLAGVLAEMARAADRDAILELLVAGARAVAREAAALAVRRDALVGWTCTPGFARRETFRGVHLPNAWPTALHEALRGGPRFVPLPRDERHAPLAAAMATAGPPPSEIAVAPVHAAGKPVAIVVAIGPAGRRAALDGLAELARAAGEALEQLLRERRK